MAAVAASALAGPTATGSGSGVYLRPCLESDMPAILEIYAYNVRNGYATFAYEAPSLDDMIKVRTEVTEKKFPYYVAVDPSAPAGSIAGYAYVNSYRTRPAYRFTVENSIYINHTATGKGVGSLLLRRLIADCTALGFRQMMAYTSNGSDTVALHEKCGFVRVGLFRSLGWKFSRWLDVCVLQLTLGEGDTTPPCKDALVNQSGVIRSKL